MSTNQQEPNDIEAPRFASLRDALDHLWREWERTNRDLIHATTAAGILQLTEALLANLAQLEKQRGALLDDARMDAELMRSVSAAHSLKVAAALLEHLARREEARFTVATLTAQRNAA